MKKYTFIFAIALFLFVTPAMTRAINLGGNLADEAARGAGYSSNTTETSFASLLGTVVKTVLSFAGVIFLILMVYAGYLWMTARGDDSQIEKAQMIIRNAVIGLIITVGAYSITAFVVPRIVEKTTGGGGGVGGQAGTCIFDYGTFTSFTDGQQTNLTQDQCTKQCVQQGKSAVSCTFSPTSGGKGDCSWTYGLDPGGSTSGVTPEECNTRCGNYGVSSGAVSCNWLPD